MTKDHINIEEAERLFKHFPRDKFKDEYFKLLREINVLRSKTNNAYWQEKYTMIIYDSLMNFVDEYKFGLDKEEQERLDYD